MSLLADKTIREFNDLLASNEPAPGGGSTAALSGLLAASLTMMVANLSFGKRSFEELDDETKSVFKRDFERMGQIKETLMDLIDKDTEAFNAFMKAMKMPKETEKEKNKRMEAMNAASLYALEIPLEVAKNCLAVLQHQSVIARYGNKNAISDIGVGILLACAGLDGAILNVRINLPGISDKAVKADAEKSIKEYQKLALELRSEIMGIVDGRL
jgi:formiminotetrahydrofolate cyclodeaminase